VEANLPLDGLGERVRHRVRWSADPLQQRAVDLYRVVEQSTRPVQIDPFFNDRLAPNQAYRRSLDHREGANCFGAMRCGKHDGEGTIGMSDQMSRAIEEQFQVRRVNLEIAVFGDRIGRVSAPINEGHSPPFSKYLLVLPGLLARRHLPVHEYDSRPGAGRCRMRCPPLTRSDVAHQGNRLPDQQHPCIGNDRGRPESAKAVAIERMSTRIMVSTVGTSRAPGTGELGHPGPPGIGTLRAGSMHASRVLYADAADPGALPRESPRQ
jgi:hypothetical protein